MAGAGAVTDAAVAADAPATRLRLLCLSAAAGIRRECDCALLLQPPPDGPPAGGDHLAGCGEPLVQLLSRQAAGLLALYEAPPSPSPSAPSPVGPGQPPASEEEEEEKQDPGAGGRPCQDGRDGPRDGGRGGHADDGVGLLILGRLDDLLSVAYSRFYAYLYEDLPLCWRQLYTDASILKFSYLFLSRPYPPPRQDGDGRPVQSAGKPEDTQLDDMVKALDLALILAGAGGRDRGRVWIDAALALLEDVWAAASGGDEDDEDDDHHHHHRGPPVTATTTTTTTTPPPAKKPRLEGPPPPPSFSAREPFTPPVRRPIRRAPAGAVDMAGFQRHLDGADPRLGPEPLVLAGLADGWPARAGRPWGSPSYLLSRTFGGRRLVPVEVGRSYVDEGWGQRVVPFGEFLREYIDPPAGAGAGAGEGEGDGARPVAYLAQHQLFAQLTRLRHDILVPDHCYTAPPPHPTDPSQGRPELEGPLLNAWFGPPGTITPLHTDPYHNLLVQVVGRKYVRLYSPHQTGRMRARGKEGGVDMGNTSLLDVGVVEGWDVSPGTEEHEDGCEDGERRGDAAAEEFKKVPFVDCILEPGDGLYIPIGWWHYVRGLSVSFSVSLWWN